MVPTRALQKARRYSVENQKKPIFLGLFAIAAAGRRAATERRSRSRVPIEGRGEGTPLRLQQKFIILARAEDCGRWRR